MQATVRFEALVEEKVVDVARIPVIDFWNPTGTLQHEMRALREVSSHTSFGHLLL